MSALRSSRRWPAWFLVALVLAPAALDLAQAGHAVATPKAQLLEPARAGAGIVWEGEHVYLVSGYNYPGQVDRYTPGTDTLVTVAAFSLPGASSTQVVGAPTSWTSLVGPVAPWTGTEVLIFGGQITVWGWETPANTMAGTNHNILRFDPLTATVEASTARLDSGYNVDMAGVWDPRHRPEAGCPGGCAYLFGGRSHGGPVTDEIRRYNPATETVTTLAARLPSPRNGASVVWDAAAGHAYVFGGANGAAGQPDVPTDEIVRYDPVADSLAVFTARMPAPRYMASAVWDGRYAYVVGGIVGGQSSSNIVRFEPSTEGVTELAGVLPRARSHAPSVWDGASLLVFGGYQYPGGPYLNDVLRYSPGPNHVPVAGISPLRAVECVDRRGTISVSALPSYDPDGSPVTYSWWSPDDVTYVDATALRTTADAPFGTSAIKLTVDDGALRDVTTAHAMVVDTRPPSTTAAFDGLPGDDTWWRSDVDVTLSATDGCAVDHSLYGIDTEPMAIGSSFRVVGDRRHDLIYASVDIGANQEAWQSVPVLIDATPPVVTLEEPEDGRAYVNGMKVQQVEDLPYTLVAGTILVQVQADDPGGPEPSGLDRVAFFVDGVERSVAAWPGPYVYEWKAGDEAAGTHVLSARAFDVAGNNATAEMDVTTVPTTQQGVVRTANFGNACRLVLGPAQCDAAEETVNTTDAGPTVDLLRDTVNTFLARCEETISRTICLLLPDELPGGPASAPGRDPPERGRGDAPRDGAVAAREGGEPE